MDEMVSARFASAGLTTVAWRSFVLAIFCYVPEFQSRLRIHIRAFNTGRTKKIGIWTLLFHLGPFYLLYQ